ncbi:MAG: MBL fold metallo-hydrolase [Alphaproteobacteria bacterium]|nr:MBL fold metallo-hydrolase [Alphaproteobacteria bacterium]
MPDHSSSRASWPLRLRVGLAVLAAGVLLDTAPSVEAAAPPQQLEQGASEPVLKVTDRIYQATGFGNTFLVLTKEGNAVVDTSNEAHARRHHEILTAVSPAPVRYVFLTHGHGDHTGGVGLWRGPETHVVADSHFTEFRDYQWRLRGFFAQRNSAQMARSAPKVDAYPGNYAAPPLATDLVTGRAEFHLGDLTFVCLSTPGETPDHMTVYVPELKAAFIGDNYYGSFPNIYTLRGTEPRFALDYVRSLDKVLELEPEIVLPSHGRPIVGKAEIERTLTKYRDAILYVHDATVRGMNEGKDAFTLMREIKLPPELAMPEGYGAISWSVRGIYEGYAGWFDMNASTMYAVGPADLYGELAPLLPANAVAARARALVADGRPELALRLTDLAFAAEPADRSALEARLEALGVLYDRAQNTIETGWLTYDIARTKKALGLKD